MLRCQYLLNQCLYWTITIDASNWDASYWTAILAMRLNGMRLSGWEPSIVTSNCSTARHNTVSADVVHDCEQMTLPECSTVCSCLRIGLIGV